MKTLTKFILGFVSILFIAFFFTWFFAFIGVMVIGMVISQFCGVGVKVTVNKRVVGHIKRFKYVPL